MLHISQRLRTRPAAQTLGRTLSEDDRIRKRFIESAGGVRCRKLGADFFCEFGKRVDVNGTALWK